MTTKKTIVICASAAFYEHVNELADQLKGSFDIVVPETARKMQKMDNYNVMVVKTWYDNPDDFKHKKRLMDQHFAEVKKGDAILVVNDQKHGVPGYIGANVLMEMAIAYILKKPIFVLNQVGQDSNVYEEVVGMQCRVLNGDVEKIKL